MQYSFPLLIGRCERIVILKIQQREKITALFTNMQILKFKSQLTIAFFAAVNHLNGPLRKQRARSIQPKFRPVRPGKEDHPKRWTRFFETFPVGPNRSIEFWTEITGKFGWMDRAQKSREIYKAVSVYWKLKLTRNVEIISMPPCACMTHNSSTYLRCSQLFHNVNNSKQQDPAVTLTLQPLDKSALQICFPIPCAPPVTMATLPWIFIP